MAKSGSIASSYGVPGDRHSPWIQLDWEVTSQDIVGNKSNISLELWLRIEGYLWYNSTMHGNLNGTSFTSAGVSDSYTWVKLASDNIVVNHNANGTGNVRLSGNFDLRINFTGNWVGNMSVAQTIALPRIPRSSTIPHFSFNRVLEEDTTNWVDLSISGLNDNNTGFNHRVWLMDGGTTVADLGTVRAGVRWITIPARSVNAMLDRMPSTTSKTFTLWVDTVDSSGRKIGSEATRNATATVGDSVIPQVTEGLTVSVDGTGKDADLGIFLKDISKARGKFGVRAGRGATITSTHFVTRRVAGDNVDRVETSGSNVTNPNPFKYPGKYEAWGIAYDSRGGMTYIPSDESTIEFDVLEYKPPSISKFEVGRVNEGTVVRVDASGTFSNLGGKNTLTRRIKSRAVGDLEWRNHRNAVLTGSGFNDGFNVRNNLITKSYIFTLELEDDFGNKISATRRLSTTKEFIEFNQDKGVGIGKRHEKGILDVAGEVNIAGILGVAGNVFVSDTVQAGILMQDGYEVLDERSISSGRTPHNGSWIRFEDGTQICYHSISVSGTFSDSWGSLYYKYLTPSTWTFPVEFKHNPTIQMSSNKLSFLFTTENIYVGSVNGLAAYRPVSSSIPETTIMITAIGRWK